MTRQGRGRAILFGAIGFGIGLAIAAGIFGSVTFQIEDFQVNAAVGALLFALGGLLGGAIFGLTCPPRRNILLRSIQISRRCDLAPSIC